jgi:hypothetical protein
MIRCGDTSWLARGSSRLGTIHLRTEGRRQEVLCPTLPLASSQSERRATPGRCVRRFVAFGYYVTICAPLATHPRISLTAPVEMARALACSGRASARRAAPRSMGTAGKVGNEPRHRGPLGAADHANPSSTVGSSPGVAKKRMPGVFSFRASNGLRAVLLRLRVATDGGGHLDHPALPIQRQHVPSDAHMRGRGYPSPCIFMRRHKEWGSGTPHAGP